VQKSVGEVAKMYFRDGFSCSEAVLKSVAEAQGIHSPLIPKIATAFGSGLAGTDGTCGALSGGYLALSMCKGRTIPDDDRNELYGDVTKLKALFQGAFGATECTPLLGFSLGAEGAGEKFQAGNCKEGKCMHFVERVAEEVMGILSPYTAEQSR
jgi:C_GCAxxG_C_C family probable redox protein